LLAGADQVFRNRSKAAAADAEAEQAERFEQIGRLKRNGSSAKGGRSGRR
jgi:hypothetical protein